MILHVLFLQPRNGSPSWPADPQQPTGTDPQQPATPTETPVPGVTVNTTATPNGTSTTITTGTSYLNQEMCEQAGRNGLIAAGGYAFGASLLGIMVFMIMRKKLWGTAFSRYATALGIAALLSSILVAWDPVRADILERCLDPNQGFTQYVFLGSMLIARALVLGLVPSVLVTFAGCFVANRT
jgi:hypothetical protein